MDKKVVESLLAIGAYEAAAISIGRKLSPNHRRGCNLCLSTKNLTLVDESGSYHVVVNCITCADRFTAAHKTWRKLL